MNEKEIKLQRALDLLELSSNKIVETQGYNRKVESQRILEELIKEQIKNAHTYSAARKVR
jgi:hypothetical protein